MVRKAQPPVPPELLELDSAGLEDALLERQVHTVDGVNTSFLTSKQAKIIQKKRNQEPLVATPEEIRRWDAQDAQESRRQTALERQRRVDSRAMNKTKRLAEEADARRVKRRKVAAGEISLADTATKRQSGQSSVLAFCQYPSAEEMRRKLADKILMDDIDDLIRVINEDELKYGKPSSPPLVPSLNLIDGPESRKD